MSLKRRGEIWHYDFTVNGDRYRASTGLRDKKAATRFEDRERERLALGSDPRQSLQLGDVAAVWYSARAADRRSAPTTARRMKIMLRHLGLATPVPSISSRHVAEAIRARRLETTRQSAKSSIKRAPTNATINRDLIDTTLRPILNYARKVLKIPVQEIEWAELRLDEPAGRVRAFSAAEMTAFRGALPRWHRPVFDFAARYGVRLQEAFFALDALDVEAGRVTLRKRKRGPDHVLPLLKEDALMLAALAGRARAAEINTLWFREMKDGSLRPIAWRGFQSACQRAVKAAQLTDARPVHDLRHHAATAILRSPRANLKTAGKLLGHADLRSTMRYVNVADDDVLEALRHTSGTPAPKPRKNAK